VGAVVPADQVVVGCVLEEVRRAQRVGVPDVHADVLAGDGATVGEHAGGEHAVAADDHVVSAGDGGAVVGRVHDGVVVGVGERRISAGGFLPAVAQQDSAAGEAPVVVVARVGCIALPRLDRVGALNEIVVDEDRAGRR